MLFILINPLDLEFLKSNCGLETNQTDWWKVLNRKFTTRDLDYFENMLRRGIKLNDNAKIIIDTIHSVKGRRGGKRFTLRKE